MPFQKGRAKTGGRVAGTKHKITRDVAGLLDKLNCNPLEGLATIANDPNVDTAIRARCHSELAKYIAPQLKAIELTGPAGGPIEVRDSSPGQLLRSRIAGIAERKPA